jgi:hypothetical protein
MVGCIDSAVGIDARLARTGARSVCPDAAKLVRRQEELQRAFSISPRYFKAYSALIASIQ